MRTTLDIDDDVLAAAKELGRSQGKTAGEVLSELGRRALSGTASAPAAGASGAAGFRPFPSRGKPVTNTQIDRLRDEENI